jgi:sugar lactone lactonase YvrE
MAIAPDGDLIVACPNFADQTKPGCLIKVGKDGRVTKWVDVPVLPETGIASPQGIEFGPDGDIYVCDNQGWSGTGKGVSQGRMLRLRIRDSRIVKTTVVAEGMEHPNGVRIRGGYLYVTESLMPKVKDPSGLLVSSVYRFALDDANVRVTNTLDDRQIIATFLSKNRYCQYGTDGIVFDHAGNLFIGVFGDGEVHKITFDSEGRVSANTVFARTDLDYSLDPAKPGFLARATRAKMRTTDGMCVDEHDNIYVADFSNNAIARITPQGAVSVVAQNGDTDGRRGELNEPGEPVVWRGRLVVSNFDSVFGPDKLASRHSSPATLSVIELP